jgi:hypothetical protein
MDLRNYTHPKVEIVTKLPDPKGVKEVHKEVLIKSATGYDKYQFIDNAWHLAGTLTKV